MRTLRVYCHPNPSSFSGALQAAAREACSGYEQRCIDLYSQAFEPVLSLQERLDYLPNPQAIEVEVQADVHARKWCVHLVFVFHIWFYAPPTMLKGWFRRVWLPGVGFLRRSRKGATAVPGLQHTTRLPVFTHGGARWWWLKGMGDPCKKLFTRDLRAVMGKIAPPRISPTAQYGQCDFSRVHRIHRRGAQNTGGNQMKSVLNAAARRHMEATKASMGPEKLEAAAQAIRLRTEENPEVAAASRPSSGTGKPLADYLAAKRVGDLLYLSGVIAVDPAACKVITRYEDLPAHAIEQLGSLGYCTGQMSVDIFEAPIVAQSWFVLQSIQSIVAAHGAQMDQVFKLVQYFRDLRDYPAYNRVRDLFCPAGVVSTVVEVSRLLPSDEVLIEVEATVSLT